MKLFASITKAANPLRYSPLRLAPESLTWLERLRAEARRNERLLQQQSQPGPYRSQVNSRRYEPRANLWSAGITPGKSQQPWWRTGSPARSNLQAFPQRLPTVLEEPRTPAAEAAPQPLPQAETESAPETQKTAALPQEAVKTAERIGHSKPDPEAGLRRLLKTYPDLPAQAAILGVCDDGFPVLLDLYDPAPGAMVIIGDEREKQLDLLRAAVYGLAVRNSPHSIQFLVLSCNPGPWEKWVAGHGFEKQCLGVIDVDQQKVREWTIRLADLTEQRRIAAQQSGPPVLLIMDTLSFLPRMEYDVRLNFEWMLKEGPAAQIWPLAAISTDLALSLGRRMLRPFPCRILGFTENAQAYTNLSMMSLEESASFARSGEFAVLIGNDWLRFRLPE